MWLTVAAGGRGGVSRSCVKWRTNIVLWLLLVGCDATKSSGEVAPASASQAPLLAPADGSTSATARPQKRGKATLAGERVHIRAGKLVAGSSPGDEGRDPPLEPVNMEVMLGAFDIDKLPYPNDPSKPPLTSVNRDKAASLCAAREGRLCTELEWERACRGDGNQRYAGGDVWEPSCAAAPNTCASELGVLAMGFALREWTSSDVQPIKRLIKHSAAVRGAGPKATVEEHRCAHRTPVAFADESAEMGFRCCYGERNTAIIESPPWGPAFKRTELAPAQLEQLLAADSRLKVLAQNVKYFREDAAENTIMRRGRAHGRDAGALPPDTYLATKPLLWRPLPGEEILLLTGQSNKDSFIVAFHVLPTGGYRLGAALHLKDELGPVVFVYNPFRRRKLGWATCWECYGEVGNITYREENRVVITQR